MIAARVSRCEESARRDGTPVAGGLPVARWVCLLILLVAEALALTLRFDTESLVGTGGWWPPLLTHASDAFHLASAVAAVTLLLGGTRLWDELKRAAGGRPVRGRWWPALLGHFAALAAFTWLTAGLLEGRLRSAPGAGAWAAAWALAGGLTLALWAAAVLPPALWLPLARRGWLALACGTVAGAAVWGAGLSANRLWQPLGHWTLWAVARLLGLVSADVVCHEADFVVGIGSFTVEVAPQCSGYEGVGLTLAFLSAYLWVFRADLRFPQALGLLPVGAGLSWLANAVRIAALVAIGAWGLPEVALGGFHSQAGWLAFLGLGLGLVAVSRRLPYLRRSRPAACGPNPVAPYLVPLLALLTAAMITRAISGGFDGLYPLRVLATAGALWAFRRTYAGWDWGWSWPAVALGAAAFGLWLALEPGRAAGGLEAGLAGLPGGWAVAWLLFRVFGSVVTVPLAEELAFRGYLSRRLIAADFERVPVGALTWFSFVVSSAAFGALHHRWLAGTAAGMLYALALSRRGRLADAVLAHATTNALVAAYVLATGDWSLWS